MSWRQWLLQSNIPEKQKKRVTLNFTRFVPTFGKGTRSIDFFPFNCLIINHFSQITQLKSFFFSQSNCNCIFIFIKYIRFLLGLDGYVLAKRLTFYTLDLLGHISDWQPSTSLDTSKFNYVGILKLLSLSGFPTWSLLLSNFVHGCIPNTIGKWFSFQSPGHSFLNPLKYRDISSGGAATGRRIV